MMLQTVKHSLLSIVGEKKLVYNKIYSVWLIYYTNLPYFWDIRYTKILEGKFKEKIFYAHLYHLRTVRCKGILYSIFQEEKVHPVVWKIQYSGSKQLV
jgi:hypothetical protein